MWADPRLVYSVAAAAVALLLITVWLFGRRKRHGRQAAIVCLLLSIGLHVALLVLVPLLPPTNGGSSSAEQDAIEEPGNEAIAFTTFDPDNDLADTAAEDANAQVKPLPVANLTELLEQPAPTTESPPANDIDLTEVAENEVLAATELPDSLQTPPESALGELFSDLHSEWGGLMDEAFAAESPEVPIESGERQAAPAEAATASEAQPSATEAQIASAPAAPANVPGALENDFANRVGAAKQVALQRTGGNARTEAAVEAALRFLAAAQRADGAWDPRASGAGREFGTVLGARRPGTGSRAESAITGLALLSLMGAGHTHNEGDYADTVYRGLAYLIGKQAPDGSLAGNAAPFAANYSHGMAALAMCEAAAMTRDAAAIESARRAVAYTVSQQHPTTGGWRYVPGDPGDLSQLGWQAMVLDGGHRAGLAIDPRAVAGIQRFLLSVRQGRHGGLASYRPNEQPSRTMTAEALATRLLIGQAVRDDEITEAEGYLLHQPPGVGKDNYYYWYYATLALHQLQDDAWDRWNTALQQRLLATQQADGSWSANTLWGGYGGTVYTTSMATLCLEVYYRHALRSDQQRIAQIPE